MNHKLSVTEFIVIVVLLLALVQGISTLYERWLVWANEVTAERMNQK